ncbi:ATP-binding protein [Streptomyces oceani]|nr:ATP-binding protein [Streptomyces oceani]
MPAASWMETPACSRLTAHELYELVERAGLLTSELATNSVCHTKGPAAVRLHWRHHALRVSMWDPCPTLPAPVRAVRDDEPTGRGLLLLDVLADRWGGCAIGEGPWAPGGKTLWFELSLGGGTPPVLAA